MKPSQIPNQLSYPPPRTVLPLQGPELYIRDRLDSHRHRLGPVHSSGSPSNIVSSTSRSCNMPRNRPGPPQHTSQPTGSFCSSHRIPVTQSDVDASIKRPQSSWHHPSPKFMRDVINYTSRDQETGHQEGRKNLTVKSQGASKAQSSDRSPTPSAQLHRHNPGAPRQDQKLRPFSENLNSAMGLTSSSQKRRRESDESNNNNTKKLCDLSSNTGKAHTPKPTVNNSVTTSPVPSLKRSSVLELPCETTNGHLCTDSQYGQSLCSEQSSTFKPLESSHASLSPRHRVKRHPPTGAKQAYIYDTQDYIVHVGERKLPLNTTENTLKKEEKNNKIYKKSSILLSPEASQRLTSSLPHVYNSTLDLPVKTPKTGNSTSNSTSNPNSGTQSSIEKNKTFLPRKSDGTPNNMDDLFTPDPMTCVISPAFKTTKTKMDGEMVKSSTSATGSSNPVTGSSCLKTQNSTVKDSSDAEVIRLYPLVGNLQSSLHTVTAERVNLENINPFSSKDKNLQHSPITPSGRQVKNEPVKSDEKQRSRLPSSETESVALKQTPLLEQQVNKEARKQVNEEEPIDMELDLGLSFALDLDLTQSSRSSEEEQLLPLQKMMQLVTKPPDTPEKGAVSEPSTPGPCSNQLKTPLQSTSKLSLYKNDLDQMLKEINTNKKAKEVEVQLLNACKEDLLRIAEFEDAAENQQEGISDEQQEFLQRYSLMSSHMREIPPGEAVFHLEKFGQIFNQDTLQLRLCQVTPQGPAQKTLLWSSPAQLKLHVTIGLFQDAYDCHSPCPAQVTRFLFKIMSVHSERIVSEKILQALCDIACTAAHQIVKNGNQQFKVWVPSLADVTLVLMNMGAPFVSLFPFEHLQPPFTEGDLLEDVYITSSSPSSNKDQSSFPEHNYNTILKYLSFCVGLCPLAYSDDELLLLLTVLGRVGLDPQLIVQSGVELFPLQYKILNNIRDWDTMMPRICVGLTDLTDDHHNMCLLVQLLPDHTRGKQLRRHLSMCLISKLIDGKCTYRPTEKEIQLSMLRPYLPRMQPSTLLRGMLSSSSGSQKDDKATLDKQSYYLCYSLLTLANEASNFQYFSAHQKEQLLHLCIELETHVKCDIRESEKCLYRTRVKDLVARIYTKWWIQVQKTRPLHDKLYDYWQPLPDDMLNGSQEDGSMEDDDNGEASVMGGDKQEVETRDAEEEEAETLDYEAE